MAESINRTYPEKILITITTPMRARIAALATAQGLPERQVIRNLLAAGLDPAPAHEQIGFKQSTLAYLTTMADLRKTTIPQMICSYTVAALTVDLVNSGLITPEERAQKEQDL